MYLNQSQKNERLIIFDPHLSYNLRNRRCGTKYCSKYCIFNLGVCSFPFLCDCFPYYLVHCSKLLLLTHLFSHSRSSPSIKCCSLTGRSQRKKQIGDIYEIFCHYTYILHLNLFFFSRKTLIK